MLIAARTRPRSTHRSSTTVTPATSSAMGKRTSRQNASNRRPAGVHRSTITATVSHAMVFILPRYLSTQLRYAHIFTGSHSFRALCNLSKRDLSTQQYLSRSWQQIMQLSLGYAAKIGAFKMYDCQRLVLLIFRALEPMTFNTANCH